MRARGDHSPIPPDRPPLSDRGAAGGGPRAAMGAHPQVGETPPLRGKRPPARGLATGGMIGGRHPAAGRTVRENVALPLRFRGRSDPALVQEWIVRVGLGPFGDNYPHELSGGMRKRAQLAQSLVADPTVLLMDEPFSALDVQTRNLMENELLNLWGAARKTVLFITHDLEEAIALSDEIVVMTAGPGTIKARYPVELPRPRNVTEIRFAREFVALYERAWADLRDEVERSYARSLQAG